MRALVIGGARSGNSVALLLNQHGYTVTLATNKDFKERQLLESKGIQVFLNDKDMSLVQDYDIVVKNPGIPMDHPLVSKFDNVVNEIEVASHFVPNYSFYAISGTNGKTTSTTLLYNMLKKKSDKALLAGNIGYALSEAVYNDGNFERDVALEIAAFQMEGTPSFSPKVYGLINLTPDHLDRFVDEEHYYNAKLKILPNVGIFVRNSDDVNIMSMTKDFKGKSVDVSLTDTTKDVYIINNTVMFHQEILFHVDDLKVVGVHNLLNAMMASTIAYLAGVSLNDISEAIKEFRGVEHRIEFVKEIRGVSYYNDSKATNPESCDVALSSFNTPIHLLMGGYDKHISFDILKKHTDKLKSIYVFGESANQITEIFPNATKVETMAEGLEMASLIATEGEVVLLSPACASYDQFDNYEQRGTIFKDLVKKIK